MVAASLLLLLLLVVVVVVVVVVVWSKSSSNLGLLAAETKRTLADVRIPSSFCCKPMFCQIELFLPRCFGTSWARATQYASAHCKLTMSSYLFARWHVFRHVGYLRHQQQVDLWPLTLKVVSESRVTWATSVPISVFLGLYSRVMPEVRDRQTEVRQTSDKSIA